MNKESGFAFRRVGTGVLLAALLLTAMAEAAEIGRDGDVARGAKAWVDNCERCHNMRDPKEFRDDQWHVIVNHMRIRGNLTGQDTRDVRRFLESAN